jgi:multimeric flavodoxin WrbA
MKVIAINGSPRKNWNTHILLENCLNGAKESGAETELINLYDINFKGCTSCFACKLKGAALSKCAMKDDLEPVLQKICECDALVLGSPIYFASVSGEMRSFLERLLFPYSSYELKPSTFGKKIKTAFIYTMNAPSFALPFIGYRKIINYNKRTMKKILGYSEPLIVTSTYQFSDYNKYAITIFKGEKRLKRRETVFVDDCKKAYALGKKLCTNSNKESLVTFFAFLISCSVL